MYKASILGDYIKGYLKKNKMSQGELAKKADVSESTISDIIRGERNPTIDTVDRIAGACGHTLIELLQKSYMNRRKES